MGGRRGKKGAGSARTPFAFEMDVPAPPKRPNPSPAHPTPLSSQSSESAALPGRDPGTPGDAERYRRQLQTIAENATLALFIMDERQVCSYMNPAAERLTGFSLAELQGKPLHDYIHHTRPDGTPYPLRECPIDQAFPEGMREQGEEVFVHRDGHFYPVSFTASPIRDREQTVGTIIEVRDITEERREREERERLIRELETERQRLSEVFENAPAYTVVVRGPDHVLEIANPAYFELIGRSDILGRPAREALPEIAAQGFIELLDTVYRTGEPYQAEEVPILLQRGPGEAQEKRYLNFVYQPLRDASGAVSGILGHAVDVTELLEARHRVEEQAAEMEAQTELLQEQAIDLEETREELQRTNAELISTNRELAERSAAAEAERRRAFEILESITDAFFALDTDWRFTYVNDEAERLLFRPRAELLGNTLWDAFPEAVGSEFEHHYLRAAREGVTVSFEAYFAPLQSWFDVRAFPSVEGLSVYFRNVNERRRMEAERDRLEAERDEDHRRLLAILEQVPVGISIAEAGTGRLLFANRQVGEVFGSSRLSAGVEAHSAGWRGYHPDGREIRPEEWPLARAVRLGETVSREVLEIDREGERRQITVNAAPIRNSAGEIIAGVAALWDITDETRREEALRMAREAAEEANRTKSDFLTVMSHELRTPLNAMIGYTDLLLAGIPDPLPAGPLQKVTRIGVSARHLLSLIEEILTFSRLEAGEETVEIQPLDLDDVLDEAMALTEPLALAKGLRYRCHRPDDAPEVRTDPRKIRQVLVNLLGNAIKFTDTGEISLSFHTDGDEALFEIRDTGRGIAPEHLDRIFEPFWQAESATVRSEGGTGLGLSVSRRLIRLLGGDITVRSEPGVGSTFTARLPLGEQSRGESPESRA